MKESPNSSHPLKIAISPKELSAISSLKNKTGEPPLDTTLRYCRDELKLHIPKIDMGRTKEYAIRYFVDAPSMATDEHFVYRCCLMAIEMACFSTLPKEHQFSFNFPYIERLLVDRALPIAGDNNDTTP